MFYVEPLIVVNPPHSFIVLTVALVAELLSEEVALYIVVRWGCVFEWSEGTLESDSISPYKAAIARKIPITISIPNKDITILIEVNPLSERL